MAASTCPGNPDLKPWQNDLGYVVLIFFALVFIMPFVLSAVTAFKTLPDIQANPVSLVADPALGGWTTEGMEALNSSW